MRVAFVIVIVYGWVMTVGQRLKRARKAQGKTQAEIADELDRTQPTVSAWETDEALPRTDEIRAVARVYRLRPEEILPPEAA